MRLHARPRSAEDPGRRRARFARATGGHARGARGAGYARTVRLSGISDRHGLFVPNRRPYYLEAQQHNLNNYFRQIHRSVRALLASRVRELRDPAEHDQKVKAEFERLSAELDRLPVKWEFIPKSSHH